MDMTVMTESGENFVVGLRAYVFKKNPAVIDIMCNGRFKGQVKMPCIPGMEYPLSYIRNYVLRLRPSLSRLELEFEPSNDVVSVRV